MLNLHERNGHAPPSMEIPPFEGRPLSERILCLLEAEGRPLKVSVIACKLKVACDSYIRGLITNLRRQGLIGVDAEHRYCFIKHPDPTPEVAPVAETSSPRAVIPALAVFLDCLGKMLASMDSLPADFQMEVITGRVRVSVDRQEERKAPTTPFELDRATKDEPPDVTGFVVTPLQEPSHAGLLGETEPANLSPLKQEILRVLREVGRPLKSTVIAMRLRHKLTSHFYQTLKDLVRCGAVIMTTDRLYAVSPDSKDS